MSFLSELLRWGPPAPQSGWQIARNDGTFQSLADAIALFQGGLYQPAYSTTIPGEKSEPVIESFLGYAQGIYKANGVIFAVSKARRLLFSDVSLKYRRLGTVGGGNDLFGTRELRILERPWPGGTTQSLLSRAEQDVTSAGTFFLARSEDGRRLLRRRPDWCEFILDAPPDEAIESNIIGYKYTLGGPRSGGRSKLYLAAQYEGDQFAEMIHWAPTPDPEAQYRGMSWLSPIVREIQADSAATKHKLKFFENAATPNLAVSLKESVTVEQFRQFVKEMNDASVGIENAYKNLYLGGGADVTVIGANMNQMDFRPIQGAGETRVCAAGRVPPIIVGLSEGLSAATYSNYAQARRAFGDSWARPQWKSFVGAVAPLVPAPTNAAGEIDAELWYDPRDVAFLREDIKDLAEVQSTTMGTINAAIAAGWTPDSAKAAVLAEDFGQLEHSGLMSVQLQPPGAGDDGPDPAAEFSAKVKDAVALMAPTAFTLESIIQAVDDRDLEALEEIEAEPAEDPLAEEDPNAPLTDDVVPPEEA